MNLADELRRIIAELDVPAIKRFRAEHELHLPQLSDEEALASLHVSRTQTETIALKLRVYSHDWLTERGYPSMLPDNLKPGVHPHVVEGVGVALAFRNKELERATPQIRKAMTDVIEEAYADNREIRVDPDKLRGRIIEARDRTIKQLFGTKPH